MVCLSQTKKFLVLLTTLCASVSTILLIWAVSSRHWLHTKELFNGEISLLGIDVRKSNVTEDLYILTEFGLWQQCTQYVGKRMRNCHKCCTDWCLVYITFGDFCPQVVGYNLRVSSQQKLTTQNNQNNKIYISSNPLSVAVQYLKARLYIYVLPDYNIMST